MTADEKIAYLEKQMRAIEAGRQNILNCPYCNGHNEPGEPFCCGTLAAAMLAICDRKEFQEQADQAARIADKQASIH